MPERKRSLLAELKDYGPPPLQIDDKTSFQKSKWYGWVKPPSDTTSMAPSQRGYWEPTGDKASRRNNAKVQREQVAIQPDGPTRRQRKPTTRTRISKPSAKAETVSVPKTTRHQSAGLEAGSAEDLTVAGQDQGQQRIQSKTDRSGKKAEEAGTLDAETAADPDMLAAGEEDASDVVTSLADLTNDGSEYRDIEEDWAEEFDRQDQEGGLVDDEAQRDDMNPNKEVSQRRSKRLRQQPSIEVSATNAASADARNARQDLRLSTFRQALSLEGYLPRDSSARPDAVEDAMEIIASYVQNSPEVRRHHPVSVRGFRQILRYAYDVFVVDGYVDGIKQEDEDEQENRIADDPTATREQMRIRDVLIKEVIAHVISTGRIASIGGVDPENVGRHPTPIKQEDGNEVGGKEDFPTEEHD